MVASVIIFDAAFNYENAHKSQLVYGNSVWPTAGCWYGKKGSRASSSLAKATVRYII